MAIDPERILRRDFPASPDGYDRAAVDAHLEAIAAAARAERPVEVVPAEQVLAAGRELLGQISRLRVELKNVSAALREQGVTISDALEELLDLGPGPGRELGAVIADAPPELARSAATPAVGPDPALAAVTPDPGPPAAAHPSGAVEDARLVALDMALGGRSRAEIERELARFELPDRAALVDAVLAAIG